MTSSTSNTGDIPTDALAEPGPDWPAAKKIWGLAWQLHWIGFGVLFGSLAVHSMFVIVMVNIRKRFCRKPLFLAINLLLFFLGATRAVYMLLDPYESRENGVEDPKWLTLLLFGIAYPCLTSAFSLIHLAFLEITKLKVGPSKLQNVKFLTAVIMLHFIIVFTAETTSSIKPELDALLIVCQSFFILWSLLLSGSFIYSGCKLIKHVNQVQKQLSIIEKDECSRNARQKVSTTKVAKVTLITSLLGLVVCGLHFYSIIGVYGMYSKVVHPSPWPWLTFQSFCRFVELAMASTIAYSVMQGDKRQRKGKTVPTNSGEKVELRTLRETHLKITDFTEPN